MPHKKWNKLVHILIGNSSAGSAMGADPMQGSGDPWAKAVAKAGKPQMQGKGKGKGKGKDKGAGHFGSISPPTAGKDSYYDGMRAAFEAMSFEEQDSEEVAFKRQVEEAMPKVMREKMATQLVAEEWNVEVKKAEELCHRGGVAIVKKMQIPELLLRVGESLRPTAMVTSQPAWELHMKGYKSTKVSCSLKVITEDGEQRVVESTKWLTQLAVQGVVQMKTEGLVQVDELLTMVRMTVKFDQDVGWKTIRGTNVADFLKRIIHETTFSSIVVREGTPTAKVLVFSEKVDAVLKASGQGGIYTKTHPDEEAWQHLELLMLRIGTTLKEAGQTAKDYPSNLGVVKKASAEQPRYGLRFADKAKLKEAADALGLEDVSQFGRFKVTGLSEQTGPAGLIAMMGRIGWGILEVQYIEEHFAVVLATTCPAKSKMNCRKATGANSIMHIKAMNKKARELFKAASVAYRSADAEGEDKSNEAAEVEEAKAARAKRDAEAKAKAEKGRKEQQDMAKKVAEAKSTVRPATRPREAGGTPGQGARRKTEVDEVMELLPESAAAGN